MPESLKLQVTVQPTTLPVGLDEIKAHLNLDDDMTTDDALVMAHLGAATEEAERFLNRALITRTLTLWLDAWPTLRGSDWWDGVREGSITTMFKEAREIALPRPKLQSVTSVSTFDDSDVETVYAATKYFVDTAGAPGRIVLRATAASPLPDRVANGLKIVFKAGYGDAFGDVPEAIREGIKRTAALLYAQRGDCDAATAASNAGAEVLWQKHRIIRL